MRLEKSRKTLQSAALARVRMFLKADLGWLRGFPLGVRANGVEWVVVPREDGRGPERIVVSADHLHRSTYRYNRLVAHFPHALPRAVEDIRAWKGGVPLLLDLLKPGVQARKPLPPSVLGISGTYPPRAARAAAELLARQPHLRRFVDAIGYILDLTPGELAPALQWADRHASELLNFLTACTGEDGLISLVAWWELCRRANYRDAEFLISIIGDPRAPTIPTHGWASHLNGLRQAIVDSASGPSRRKLPAMPQPVLIGALQELALDALRQADDVRRRGLKLLGIVLDVDLLGLWEAAWRRLDETPYARQHILPGQGPAAVQFEVKRVEARIQTLLREHPPEVHVQTLLSDVRTMSAAGGRSVFLAVCRGLKALPPVHEGILVRAAFLHNWVGKPKTQRLEYVTFLRRDTPPDPLFAMAVRRLASYLATKGGEAALLRPWTNILEGWNEGPSSPWSVMDRILEEEPDPPIVEMTFRVLEKALAAKPHGVDYDQACVLADLVKTLKNPELALDWADRLAAVDVKGPYLDADLIHSARALASAGDDFGHLYKNLRGLDAGRIDRESLVSLEQALHKSGWSGIVAKAVISGDGASVLALSARRRALRSLGGNGEPPARVPVEQAPAWVSQYPPEFAAALAGLAVLGEKAERAARRVLGQDFIPTAAIRTEMAVLESKLRGCPDGSHLARRLAGLRKRLASSMTPAAKSRRAMGRLDRAVPRAVFRVWNRRLEEECISRFKETLGVTSIGDEFSGPSLWQVLPSIMDLSDPFRKVGLELLRRRSGPPPWNLFGHPANRAFLDRISRKGINAAPWIEPAVVHEVRSKNGRDLRLAFADDPLDIFRMGAYFQTCLSPGGSNFYSTVSNAADVNKRVLFARDAAGRVVGRCLFALSDRSGILTFHPYCHDNCLGFPEIVSRFAAEMASRMNTGVAARGRVEPLVLPKWYDDGPRDTGFRFPYLKDGSAFRSQIGRLEPADFLEAVRKTVAPLVPSALTLPPIVMLPELEERPELVVPLVGLLEDWEDVPVEVWKRAADLAIRAERGALARRIFNKRIVPNLSRQMRNEILDSEGIELGLKLDPSALLRVFRQTRPRSVKGDEAEPPERSELIIKIHEALGRGRLASRLRAGP